MALHSSGVLVVWEVRGPMEVRVDLGLLCGSVAAPGESLAGADRPATTTPVGVAILLGGVVGNLHSLYSRIKFFG